MPQYNLEFPTSNATATYLLNTIPPRFTHSYADVNIHGDFRASLPDKSQSPFSTPVTTTAAKATALPDGPPTQG